MNIKKAFLASILTMFNFDTKSTYQTKKGANVKNNQAKIGSMNVDMKRVHQRSIGTISRIIARKTAKAIKAHDKKEQRIYDRKHNQAERRLRFQR